MTTTAVRPGPGTAGSAAGLPPGQSPTAQALLARLDEPRTAQALHDLLDHAELLALAAVMADGLLRRSETITGNLAEGLADLRHDLTAGAPPEDLRALLRALRDVLPALRALLDSELVQPATVEGLGALTGALSEGLADGRRRAHGAPRPDGTVVATRGVRGLLAQLRDPATVQGLGTLLAVARALGRRSAG